MIDRSALLSAIGRGARSITERSLRPVPVSAPPSAV